MPDGQTVSPATVFVTGASGFIGLHLVRGLLERGHEVRALSGRPNETLNAMARENKNLRPLHGDIVTMYDSDLDKLVAGSSVVYHLAGLVSYQSRDIEKQRQLNVGGTRKMAAAAMRTRIDRFIHTSSIAAMGIPEKDGDTADETIEYNLTGLGLGYCDSKQEAEQVIFEFAAAGLNAVILCPGIVFGEGDNHPHHFRIFKSMSRGWSIFVPRGGIPFSDINDTVAAHLNAFDMGRAGERYCLVSANRTFKEAAQTFASIYGGKAAALELPAPVTLAAGYIGDFVLYPLGFKNALSRQQAYLANKKIFFSSGKAAAELKFHQTPFEETVRRTAPYYLGHAL